MSVLISVDTRLCYFQNMRLESIARTVTLSRLDVIESITTDPRFIEFSKRVLASGPCEDRPNMANIDLMSMPALVPNIYILDFRKGIDDGLLMKFAGSEVERNYPKPLQGNYLDKLYTGHDHKELFMNVYRRAYQHGESFYTRRVVRYEENGDDQKYRLATALFFTCFSEAGAVDYGIGLAYYDFAHERIEPAFSIV